MSKNEMDEFWFRFRRQFFKKIFAAFKTSGISQKELAEKIGKDPARVSKWLRGDDNMTLRTMYMLARAIEFRPEIRLVPLSSLNQSNHFHDPQALYNATYPQTFTSSSATFVNPSVISGSGLKFMPGNSHG